MTRDWAEWHRAYTDPDSEQSMRLAAVTHAIVEVLDASPPGPIRVLSLCAGEARDLAGAAIDHPRSVDVVGCAVELNAGLASIAASNLRAAGTGVEVRCADAGRSVHWMDLAPVDLLLVCGIFGNITENDIQRIITSTPSLLRAGGTIVWTRHRREGDLTPSVRAWFEAAGCEEVAFVSPGAGKFGVGVARMLADSPAGPVPEVLFRFVEA
jgi:SAM-dependent methyltransferase